MVVVKNIESFAGPRWVSVNSRQDRLLTGG